VNTDLHERARMLIALSGPEPQSNLEQSWLAEHLESCAQCREFAQNSSLTIHSLHTTPVTADVRLVSATNIRVRARAQELNSRQERLWVVWVCCVTVTLCSVFSTVITWRGFEWVGRQMQLSALVWQSCFAMFCLMPAILAAILLLARGTYLSDHSNSFQE
jgi:hypothetical protein